MKKVLVLTVLMNIATLGITWGQGADTVVVELAHSSKMLFTMKDKSDLPLLKQYDYQSLMNDILKKLGATDTILPPVIVTPEEKKTTPSQADAEDKIDNDKVETDHKSPCYHKVYQSFNFDFGINNYLENGSFPDYSGAQYTVHPWGSWYVGINSILHMDMGQRFFADIGLGISWYNFKFQEDNTLITKTENGVTFTEDPRDLDFTKSKLEVTYINASFIPMYAFGDSHRHSRFYHNNHDSFRLGLGPYVGYRIESHSKLVHNLDGDKKVEKNKDNFYLNNIRYGLKFQMGVQGADFFIAYDLNPLFANGKGPELHAITFGVVF